MSMLGSVFSAYNDTKSYIEERHGIFWGRVVRGNSI